MVDAGVKASTLHPENRRSCELTNQLQAAGMTADEANVAAATVVGGAMGGRDPNASRASAQDLTVNARLRVRSMCGTEVS